MTKSKQASTTSSAGAAAQQAADSASAPGPMPPSRSGGGSSKGASIWAKSLAGAAKRKSDPGKAFGDATKDGGGAIPFKKEMEEAFGQDFGSVKATFGKKDDLDGINAKAATDGETVAFADANPDKDTVAHELTHVVQKRKGGGGDVQGKGGLSSPSAPAEKEATSVAAAVAGGGKAPAIGASAPAAVHREEKEGEEEAGFTEDDAWAQLGKGQIVVPVVFQKTITADGWGSIAVGLNLTLKDSADWISGTLKVTSTDNNLALNLDYDFDKNLVGGGAGLFGSGFDMRELEGGKFQLKGTLDILQWMLRAAAGDIKKMTKGKVTPTFTGAVSLTALCEDGKGVRLSKVAVNLGLGIGLDFSPESADLEARALQEQEHALGLKEAYEKGTPEERAAARLELTQKKKDFAASKNPDALHDKLTASGEVGGLNFQFSYNDVPAAALKFGVAFDVYTEYGAEGEVDQTVAKSAGWFEVTIGVISVKVTVDSEGHAFASEEQRRELDRHALKDAISSALETEKPGALTDHASRWAAAQRINRAVPAAYLENRAAAQKKLHQKVKETETGFEITEFDVANAELPRQFGSFDIYSRRKQRPDHISFEAAPRQTVFLAAPSQVRAVLYEVASFAAVHDAITTADDIGTYQKPYKALDKAYRSRDWAAVDQLCRAVLAAGDTPKYVRAEVTELKRQAQESIRAEQDAGVPGAGPTSQEPEDLQSRWD